LNNFQRKIIAAVKKNSDKFLVRDLKFVNDLEDVDFIDKGYILPTSVNSKLNKLASAIARIDSKKLNTELNTKRRPSHSTRVFEDYPDVQDNEQWEN